MKIRLQVLCDEGEALDRPVKLDLPSGKSVTFTGEAATHVVDVAEFGIAAARPRKARAGR